MLEEGLLQKIEDILDKENQASRSWFERSALVPQGALKLCYAAVEAVRRNVSHAAEAPQLISISELVRELEEKRYEFLELWYDEDGFASGTYRGAVRKIAALESESS